MCIKVYDVILCTCVYVCMYTYIHTYIYIYIYISLSVCVDLRVDLITRTCIANTTSMMTPIVPIKCRCA